MLLCCGFAVSTPCWCGPPASVCLLGICECQLCVSSGWRVGNGKEKDLETNTKFFKAYNAFKAIFDKNNSRKDTMLLQLLSNLSKNTLLMFLLFLLITQILFDNLILHFTLCLVLAVRHLIKLENKGQLFLPLKTESLHSTVNLPLHCSLCSPPLGVFMGII